MVLLPVAHIVGAATCIAVLISTSVSTRLFKNKVDRTTTILAMSGGSQVEAAVPVAVDETESDELTLIEITPEQRDALMSKDGRNCPTDEFDRLFDNISGKIRDAFERDGVVVVRGLIDDDMLNRVVKAGDMVVEDSLSAKRRNGSHFTSMKFGPVFMSPPRDNTGTAQTSDDAKAEGKVEPEELRAFREVALSSAIPGFIAKLLLNYDEGGSEANSLRLLRDCFLAKGEEESYCGWHVDDFGFWPTSAFQAPGVNAWIALDDIPASLGGGLAVSVRSHKADWRHEAYKTIGSTKTFPKGGYESAAEVFGNSPTTTCNLAEASPELAKQIEQTERNFDYKRGDVLLHTRWIFHRSVPITSEGLRRLKSSGKAPVVKRYTIRYEPGTARVLEGFSMEPSVLYNSENAGKPLEDVSARDGPFYPKCWPEVNPTEIERMRELVDDKLPATEEMKMQRMKELMPYMTKKPQANGQSGDETNK